MKGLSELLFCVCFADFVEFAIYTPKPTIIAISSAISTMMNTFVPVEVGVLGGLGAGCCGAC